MLSVVISRIQGIAVAQSYTSLSLPLGSEARFEVLFMDKNSHLFAKNVEGVNVRVLVSHPNVVRVELEENGRVLRMRANH